MNRKTTWAIAGAVAVVVVFSVATLRACTGIRLRSADGSVVHARTMEFGLDLKSTVFIIPRNFDIQGSAPDAQAGLAWKTKYAAIGMNAQGQPILVDGVNEKGLAAGAFYFPGYAQYQEVAPSGAANSLAAWQLVTWLLTNFATVAEVRAQLPTIQLTDALPPGWTSAPPAHFIAHDAAGNSLVIEYIAGQLHLHDNPLGVITNSPDFPWHVTNLRNYVNLSPVNSTASDLSGVKVAGLGQGSGLLGLPGDYTPPSRFVRAALLASNTLPTPTGEAAVEQAFHVLNSFDITLGDVRDTSRGETDFELTQWTTASDTHNRVFYFHTYNNRRVRRVELLKADLDAAECVSIPLDDRQDFEDLTPAATRRSGDTADGKAAELSAG